MVRRILFALLALGPLTIALHYLTDLGETAEFVELTPDGSRALEALQQTGTLGELLAALPADDRAARTNLTRFAETLLPLLDDDVDKAVPIAQAALDRFDPQFQAHLIAGFRRKLGLATEEAEDVDLIRTLLDTMQQGEADLAEIVFT